MKEKLKTHKLIGIEISNSEKLVSVGKLKQKGLAHDAYWSMGKCYYWIKRGNKVEMEEIKNNKGYYIKIKSYYKKDGTLVSSHYRRIKSVVKLKNINGSESNDPNQLSLTF